MFTARNARQNLRRTITRTAAAAALAAVAGAGLTAGPAHAFSSPNLVGAATTAVITVGGPGALVFASVKNESSGAAGASIATVRYQPLSQFTVSGRTYYYDTPFSVPIVATGSVDPIPGRAYRGPAPSAEFSTTTAHTPYGLHRVTVCADSTSIVAELSETDNCFSEIKQVVPIAVG